jgi:hypothetical protein
MKALFFGVLLGLVIAYNVRRECTGSTLIIPGE